jgi:type II secretory pathway component PulF
LMLPQIERLVFENGDASHGQLSTEDVAQLSEHLARLDAASLPLPGGLRALSEEMASGALRRALVQIADQLEQGKSLNEAFASQGKRFPPHLQGLVLAGLRSGHLGGVLEQYAEYHHLTSALQRRVWVGMTNPSILLGTLLLLMIFISQIVVHQFVPIFADFGIDLPKLTIFLIQIAKAMLSVGGWLLVAFPVGLVVVVLMMLFARDSRWSFLFWIPLIGPLVRWLSLVEFSHLLALLLESRLPLSESLVLAGGAMRSSYLAWACRSMSHDVMTGMPLAAAMTRTQRFPIGLAHVVQWAEGHRSLPEALHLAGELYEARARAQASLIGIVFTLLTVLLVICSLTLLVLGIFLPLYNLMARLAL